MYSFVCRTLCLVLGSLMFASVCLAENYRHIPYPAGMDSFTEGSAAASAEINHKKSPYFGHKDYYNLKSNKSLTILTQYPTYQQTTEYTCGPAAALTVLWYYNKRDTNERELAQAMGSVPLLGTNVEQIGDYFRGLNWVVHTSMELDKEMSFEDMQQFVKKELSAGHPIMVEDIAWGGHWRVIIGYDDMNTASAEDDVLILADSYDTWDHLQDGYNAVNASFFYYSWFDKKCLPEEQRSQPFVLAYPLAR